MDLSALPINPAPRDRAADERRAFGHEHTRLYAALETAAQLAELAGHDILAASLRRDRRDVASELDRGVCDGHEAGL